MARNSAKLPQAILGIVIVVGFFSILIIYLTGNVAKDTEVGLLLIGSLSAAFGAIVQFYFGSSVSSAEKTELLAGRNPYLNATNRTLSSRRIPPEPDSQPIRYKEQADGSYRREPEETSGDSGTSKRILRRKTSSN